MTHVLRCFSTQWFLGALRILSICLKTDIHNKAPRLAFKEKQSEFENGLLEADFISEQDRRHWWNTIIVVAPLVIFRFSTIYCTDLKQICHCSSDSSLQTLINPSLFSFQQWQICPYGTIQFDRNRFNQRPYNFGQRYWLRFSSIIAPYWARTDLGRSFTSGPSKVFYHIYSGRSDAELLKNVTSDVLRSEAGASLPKGKTFQASWVLVVTWVNLRYFQLNPITEKLVRRLHLF